VQHRWETTASDKGRLTIEGSVQTDFRPVDFYPYPDENLEVVPAAKTLPTDPGRFAFSKTVRDEVDLEELKSSIMGVVENTLQPDHISLWLREAGTPKKNY
jgi:hypothetical protein